MGKSIAKIIIIILVLAGTFGALIYWGAKSYQESARSVQSLAKPDTKTHLTNAILKTIFEADLQLNSFILTNKVQHKESAARYAVEADSLIISLERLLVDEPVQQMQLDSLKSIILEKTRINRILMDLKKRQNSQFFTEQALNKIKIQLSDSAYIDKSITQKQDMIVKSDTIEQIDVVKIPDNYKGFNGFFRKLFGKEKVQFDTITTQKEQLNYSFEISENSKIVRDYFVDTTVMMVKEILLDVLEDEIQLQRKLYAAELEIINYNGLLLSNIKLLLEELSSTNESSLKNEQKDAILKIEEAQKEAFIIAGAGILLGLILLGFLIKDITQSILYRRKLEEEKERAEQLAAAKESFLAGMSHEIRTPLHSISGFTSLLENEITHAKQKKFLTGISQANKYLYQLISNILEQAKINAGTYNVEYAKIFIPDLCNELELLFQNRQLEKDNRLNIHFSELLKQYQIDLDGIKLKQVLVNLLENAFKFTEHGNIDLKFVLSENKQFLHVTVSDTGRGIDARFHQQIFQPFSQIAGNQEVNINGTGLGLSISKHIIESFGGTIKVTSELAKGSVFSIIVPVTCVEYKEEISVAKEETADDLFYAIKVLAVEDDEWNAYLLENFLASHLLELKVCGSAEDALVIFEQDPSYYDLILTDLNLPHMDGKQLLNAVLSIRILPVFVLSASMSIRDKEELTALGFTETIGKPFTKEKLLEVLNLYFESTGTADIKGNELLQVNLKGVVDFFPDNILLQKEQLDVFYISFKSKMIGFRQAIEQEDVIEMSKYAHQLKSNCEQIAIYELSERFQSIEVFAVLGNVQRATTEARLIFSQLELIEEKLQIAISDLSASK